MQTGKSVIFCATPRSGSTLVVDDFLNVVGTERKNSEILYTRIVVEKDTRPWNEVWQEVSEENQVQEYFVGKVMLHHVPMISAFIERGSTAGVSDDVEFVPERFDSFYQFFASAVWVSVYRADVFGQAVSLYLAETTNLWERLTEGVEGEVPAPGAIPGVEYDSERLKGYVQWLCYQREQWQCFFRHYGIVPLTISYEEATLEYPDYLGDLLDQTGRQRLGTPPPRRMLKVGDGRNQLWAELLRQDYSRMSGDDDKCRG